MALSFSAYGRNWRKVSRVIRRVVGYRCEECGAPVHSVHHKGSPWATGDGWREGSKRDKHDIRRCNLVALCFSCHDFIDDGALSFYASLKAKGKAKRAKHRALNVGCGLVMLKPVRITSFHWRAFSILHYALLRWSKRAGRNQYRYIDQPVKIVDSYLVEVV